ncbi:MAG: S-layer homology domain-containing protein [Kiritimatiellales bacterium]|nr:S-layer homology domain-containing protein [Kiritimatiellales bacterium]
MFKRLIPIVMITLFVTAGVAKAFLDEVVQLKQELMLWETTHAADFSEILAQLDDMTGTVFRDIKEDDWFNSYVASLSEWGIVSGYSDSGGNPTGEFRPGNSVTMAEILKMTSEAAHINKATCSAGEDIGHWANAYVQCARKRGVRIIRDAPVSKLDQPVSRAEVLVIMHDVFGDDVLPLFTTFRDVSGHPYEADVAFAALFGVVNGDTNDIGAELGTFRPDDRINRAEVSKVLYEKIKLQTRQDQVAQY